jgi:DNA-binding MarR family transcriptional regulator
MSSLPKQDRGKDGHAQALHDIERELTVLLHRVRRATIANALEIHPELQPAAYPVLLHVVDHGPTRAADMVEHFGLDKSAISRQLAHLEALGLVQRETHPTDRRASVLRASSLAKRRVTSLRSTRRARFADKLASWSDDELAALASQLARYNSSLES